MCYSDLLLYIDSISRLMVTKTHFFWKVRGRISESLCGGNSIEVITVIKVEEGDYNNVVCLVRGIYITVNPDT